MPTFRVSASMRKKGALGVQQYFANLLVVAANREAALLKLYENYEHIHNPRIELMSTEITPTPEPEMKNRSDTFDEFPPTGPVGNASPPASAAPPTEEPEWKKLRFASERDYIQSRVKKAREEVQENTKAAKEGTGAQ